MNTKISDAIKRLERACIAGMDEEFRDDVQVVLNHLAADAVPVAWQSMVTCPRDGSVVWLRWGEDHVSPGWWSAPVSPIQNEDGTWPAQTGGFPWAFFDRANRETIVNHAVDTKYGPTHWAVYTHPQPAELAEQQGVDAHTLWAMAQLAPGEGIEDGVQRIEKALDATGKQQVGEAMRSDLSGYSVAASQVRRGYDVECDLCGKFCDTGAGPCQQVGEVQKSPMAKMAAALREKAAIEHTEYSQRVQSGEWGTMPEAGTQADFCRYCEGSGWDGESRKTKCPDCSGTGMSRLLIGEAG